MVEGQLNRVCPRGSDEPLNIVTSLLNAFSLDIVTVFSYGISSVGITLS